MTPEAVNTTYQAETDDVGNSGQKEEVIKDLELTGITSSVLGDTNCRCRAQDTLHKPMTNECNGTNRWLTRSSAAPGEEASGYTGTWWGNQPNKDGLNI